MSTNYVVSSFSTTTGSKRSAIFQCFSGAYKLNCRREFGKINDGANLGSGCHAHRYVIFFAAVRGHVIDACRMSEYLCFVQKGNSRYLQYHEARRRTCVLGQERWQIFVGIGIDETIDTSFGDADQVSQRDGRIIKSERQGRAVKIPS